jgi:hypothetical protein
MPQFGLRVKQRTLCQATLSAAIPGLRSSRNNLTTRQTPDETQDNTRLDSITRAARIPSKNVALRRHPRPSCSFSRSSTRWPPRPPPSRRHLSGRTPETEEQQASRYNPILSQAQNTPQTNPILTQAHLATLTTLELNLVTQCLAAQGNSNASPTVPGSGSTIVQWRFGIPAGARAWVILAPPGRRRLSGRTPETEEQQASHSNPILSQAQNTPQTNPILTRPPPLRRRLSGRTPETEQQRASRSNPFLTHTAEPATLGALERIQGLMSTCLAARGFEIAKTIVPGLGITSLAMRDARAGAWVILTPTGRGAAPTVSTWNQLEIPFLRNSPSQSPMTCCLVWPRRREQQSYRA